MFLLLVVIFVSLLLPSCQKDNYDPEPGIKRTDNPPAELFNSDADYGSYYYVFLEKYDIEKIKPFGKFQTGSNSYYNQYDGTRTIVYIMEDFYKIYAKKFYKKVGGVSYVSKSEEYYLISSSDLEMARIKVDENGHAVIGLGSNNIDYRWRTISGFMY